MQGRFTKGEHRIFLKKCSCGNDFISRSGSRMECDSCREQKSICPECSGKKSLYDKFCGNSCAGKWKFRNSEKVRNAIKLGIALAHNTASERAKRRKGIPNYNIRGDRNPNWKGGTYRNERNILMGRVEYTNWRKSVFERDNYTCRMCGTKGGDLEADHIIPYYVDKDKVLELSNGRTVCVPCHKQLPTWGHKVKTQYQVRK